jgi:hypothetical protein
MENTRSELLPICWMTVTCVPAALTTYLRERPRYTVSLIVPVTLFSVAEIGSPGPHRRVRSGRTATETFWFLANSPLHLARSESPPQSTWLQPSDISATVPGNRLVSPMKLATNRVLGCS